MLARARRRKSCVAADVTTEEYPGFATDMQAQFMALATQAEGASRDHRNDFREPLHARQRNGAHGRGHFDRRAARRRARADAAEGATVIASDLRASASLVLAGLVAQAKPLSSTASTTSTAATSASRRSCSALGAQHRAR